MYNVFFEEGLLLFVQYWGGNTEWIKDSVLPKNKKRAITATVFWVLHHPELFESLSFFWKKCVRLMIDRSRINIWYYNNSLHSAFRSRDCCEYFVELRRMWIDYFDTIYVARFRYQNFNYLSLEQLADMVEMVL